MHVLLVPARVFLPPTGLCQWILEEVSADSLGIKQRIKAAGSTSSVGPLEQTVLRLMGLGLGAPGRHRPIFQPRTRCVTVPLSRASARVLASISHDALQLIFIFSIFSCFICPNRTWTLLDLILDFSAEQKVPPAAHIGVSRTFNGLMCDRGGWGGDAGGETGHVAKINNRELLLKAEA